MAPEALNYELLCALGLRTEALPRDGKYVEEDAISCKQVPASLLQSEEFETPLPDTVPDQS